MSQRLSIAFVALAAFLCLSSGSIAGQEQKSKLTIDVYYESLCPYSASFFAKELVPAYKDLKDFMTVNLVPFGKASWVIGDETRPTEFTCPHGPNECRGNRAQICAIHEIDQNVLPEDRQQKTVDIVGCAMASRNPASAVPQCARRHGLSSESIGSIETCERSNLGNELLLAQGEKTKAFEDPILVLPSIVINGEKKQEANGNFVGVVCQQLAGGEKPSVCGTGS